LEIKDGIKPETCKRRYFFFFYKEEGISCGKAAKDDFSGKPETIRRQRRSPQKYIAKEENYGTRNRWS